MLDLLGYETSSILIGKTGAAYFSAKSFCRGEGGDNQLASSKIVLDFLFFFLMNFGTLSLKMRGRTHWAKNATFEILQLTFPGAKIEEIFTTKLKNTCVSVLIERFDFTELVAPKRHSLPKFLNIFDLTIHQETSGAKKFKIRSISLLKIIGYA